jgi:hypothetical protein
MSDFFREVDEELRRSQIEAIWKKYANLIIGVAVAIVLATAAWRGYDYYQNRLSQQAGAKFEEAIDQARSGKSDEAERTLAGMLPDAPSGYRMLARFRLAAETGKRDPAAGIKAFRDLAADTSLGSTMQDLARLRAAMLAADREPAAEVMKTLEPLATASNPWRHQARELLGLLALKSGDYEAAGRWFDQVVIDPQAPATLRQRVQQLSGLVAAGPLPTAGQ